jgi:hypothetical protein
MCSVLLKTAALAVTVATTTISITTLSPTAQAATFTVNGRLYDITTVHGSFNDLQSQLQTTPWWGNPGLASQFANTVLGSLGFPNQAGSNIVGPTFAYGSRNTINGFFVLSSQFVPAFNGSSAILSDVSGAPRTYAIATEIPSLALLPGLIGMGIALVRKRNATLT